MSAISNRSDPVVLQITVADVVEALARAYANSRPCYSTTSALERCMRSAVLSLFTASQPLE